MNVFNEFLKVLLLTRQSFQQNTFPPFQGRSSLAESLEVLKTIVSSPHQQYNGDPLPCAHFGIV